MSPFGELCGLFIRGVGGDVIEPNYTLDREIHKSGPGSVIAVVEFF